MVRLQVGIGLGGATVVVSLTTLVLIVALVCVTVSVAGFLVDVERVVAVVLVDVDEAFELCAELGAGAVSFAPASQLSMQRSGMVQSGPLLHVPHIVHYARCQFHSYDIGS